MTAVLQEQNLLIEEIRASDPEWESFVSKHTTDFFCLPAWSRILDAGYGIQTRIYVLKKDGEIVLGIPAAYFNFVWFSLIHAYTPYGEFAGDSSLIPVFLKMLEAYLAQTGISQMRITRQHYEAYEIPSGYRVREDCVQIADLSGRTESGLFDSYKKNARRDVRIGQRAGLKSCVLQTTQEIDEYYAVYLKTMKRKRVFGPHPRRLYHEIQNGLSREQAVFLGAQYQGKLIGGVIVIFWNNTAYLLGNASDPDYHKLCPNDFMIHEALTLAVKKKMHFFDFMTTGENWKKPGNLSAFKEKWGAARHSFQVLEKDLHPVRAAVWNFLWVSVNTPFGSACLRLFFNR